MIKVSEFIEQHKQGKISNATMIKMAAFKAELEKTGFGGQFISQAKNLMKDSAPAILAGGATMGLGALIYEGIKGIEKAWTNYRLDAKKQPMFDRVLEQHPELKEQEDLAARYFDALWHFSPSMAQEPLTAGAYIKQALQMHHVAQGPLPEMVTRTTEIQKNLTQAAPHTDYATPLGAFFLSTKPQAGAIYKNIES